MLNVCLKSECRVIEDCVFTGIRNLGGFFLIRNAYHMLGVLSVSISKLLPLTKQLILMCRKV